MSTDHVQHPYGQPESLLNMSFSNAVQSNLDPIIRLLEHVEVKNRKIVVFSIIGAYRKGKSFFLDYCLRYMYANYSSINCPNSCYYGSNWMGDEDEPLLGFSWRSGSVRDTTGIILWNDVFLHTDDETGDDIAIIVMDTQGLFDNESSTIDNSRIFTLGTLLSSIQVLNLSGVIQEDQLQHLHFATEFAKLAAKNCHNVADKPFQNLTFLIRDWQSNEEYPFGVEGGEEYMNKILQIKSTQSQDLKSVRRFIQTSFKELNCSLLPYPGRAVAEGVVKGIKYNGNWGRMNEDFKDELEKTIEYLLEPEKISKWTKKINGKDINGKEFLGHLKTYFMLMQSDQLPKVESIYEGLVEKEMNTLVNGAVQKYMDIVSKSKSVITSAEFVPIIHDSGKSQAIILFVEANKFGDPKHETNFRQILEQKIDLNYNYWRNEVKANLRKIENEKQKVEDATRIKYQKERDMLEKEKRRIEKNYEDEFDKLQASFEKLKLSKNEEIAKLKKEIKQNLTIQERKNDLEILKARMKLEKERVMKEMEIAELKHQLAERMEAINNREQNMIFSPNFDEISGLVSFIDSFFSN